MNSKSPVRLSVVTVCRNDFRNVTRTMTSLTDQVAEGGWEHVLIDGASSDGTVDWYQNASWPFPNRLLSEADEGIFDAMNKSLKYISGDYVIFMNAGDQFSDCAAIERMLKRLGHEPTWGYSKARVVDSAGNRVRPQVGHMPYARWRHLLGRATICHQAVVMRADFIRELGGFDVKKGSAADYHLLIKAASLSAPVTWADVDVDYLAGGVTDSGDFSSLWDRHRARVDALALGRIGAELDRIWTALQVIYIRLRKRLKPVFGPVQLKIRR